MKVEGEGVVRALVFDCCKATRMRVRGVHAEIGGRRLCEVPKTGSRGAEGLRSTQLTRRGGWERREERIQPLGK